MKSDENTETLVSQDQPKENPKIETEPEGDKPSEGTKSAFAINDKDEDDQKSKHFGLFDGHEESDVQTRLGFIRKVYGILSTMLLFTFGGVITFAYAKEPRLWLQGVPLVVMIATMIGAFVIELMLLCCCRSLTKKVPINFILLGAFTVLYSITIWMITIHYTPESVVLAAGLTAAVTCTLTTYAFFTKTDLTMKSGLILSLCVVSFILMFASVFMSWAEWWHPFVSGFMVLLYGMFLIYDT